MKNVLWLSFVALFPAICFADADVSAINAATTVEALNTATKSAIKTRPTAAKEAGVDDTEIKKATEPITKAIAESGNNDNTKKPAISKKKNESATPDTPETTKRELTDAEKAAHEERISELKDNADALKENQQSAANKALTGAAIGTMGGGLAMALQGASEKNADADAESDMRAYLNTFRCDYGTGKNTVGGDANVELPGMNALTSLFTEYVTLADNVKSRKEALGLSAGIESELILDASNLGLYDDKSVGITGGHYASQYRALTNPGGDDAEQLAAATKASKDMLIGGATMAAAGLVGSTVGNILINKDAPENRVNKINADYDKLLREQAALPTQTCSKFTGTNGIGDAPNCTCKDSNDRFFAELGCQTCPNDRAYNRKNECVSPKCIGDDKNTGLIDDDCNCIANAYADDDGDCVCLSEFEQVNGECVPAQEYSSNQSVFNFNFESDKLFTSGQSGLGTKAANDFMNSFNAELNKQFLNSGLGDSYCVTVIGHTDRVPCSRTNTTLSEERANTIKKLIAKANGPFDADKIIIKGAAERKCYPHKYKADNDPQCRRVEINISNTACPTTAE